MAPVKFTYFNIAALGEPVRMALALSGVEWTDVRVEFADWPPMKEDTPYKQLPIMEVDGKIIPQSNALLRYAGKMGDLYPTCPVEAALADAAVEAVMDIHRPMRESIVGKDEEKKMEMRKELAETLIPAWETNVQKMLEQAGGKYFAGDKLSIGDVAIVARLNWIKDGSLDGIPTTIVDDFPLLSSLIERVMAEPKIVAYLESKPKK
ncbi:unnamed protein product [Pylaiella littoralis]